jgi:hypothetical protein
VKENIDQHEVSIAVDTLKEDPKRQRTPTKFVPFATDELRALAA